MEIHALIEQLLKDTQQPVIFELGANNGMEIRWFLKTFNAKVYAFEPDPDNTRRIVSKKYVGVTLVPCAVGAKTGKIGFYKADNLASGSIHRPKDHLKQFSSVKFESEPIEVCMVSLDDYCRDHKIDHIDLIWMDVQGAEKDVFMGGTQTTQKTRYIYTEFFDNELYEGQENLAGLLKRLKTFDIVEKYRHDVLLVNRLLKNMV